MTEVLAGMTDAERLSRMSRKEIHSEIIHLSREQEEYARQVAYLEEQLRDRDKTIAELNRLNTNQANFLRDWKLDFDDLKNQNTIMLSALVKIRTRLGDFQEPWNDREREIDEIASEAITQVTRERSADN